MVDAEVIERLKQLQDRYDFSGDYYKALEVAIERIKQPERARGHWLICVDKNGKKFAKCTTCGGKEYNPSVYCKDCGLKMERLI